MLGSWSASSVPVQRKLPLPVLKTIRATAFIWLPQVPAWHMASISQAATALGTWKSRREEVTRCETSGAAIFSSEGLVPAGSSISITIVSDSITGDQYVRASRPLSPASRLRAMRSVICWAVTSKSFSSAGPTAFGYEYPYVPVEELRGWA